METQIPIFLLNASEKSYELAKRLDIKIDCERNVIKLNDEKTGVFLGDLKLSKNLSYKLTGGVDYKETGLTDKGTWSSTFTIYVFDKKYKKVYFKVTTHNAFGRSTIRTRVPKKDFNINDYLTGATSDWFVKEIM